jgi:hypothetical protein
MADLSRSLSSGFHAGMQFAGKRLNQVENTASEKHGDRLIMGFGRVPARFLLLLSALELISLKQGIVIN